MRSKKSPGSEVLSPGLNLGEIDESAELPELAQTESEVPVRPQAPVPSAVSEPAVSLGDRPKPSGWAEGSRPDPVLPPVVEGGGFPTKAVIALVAIAAAYFLGSQFKRLGFSGSNGDVGLHLLPA